MPQILELSLLALYRQNKKHVVLSPTALTLTVSLYSERCRCTLYGHTDSVNSIEFFPCSNILLTALIEEIVSKWLQSIPTEVVAKKLNCQFYLWDSGYL